MKKGAETITDPGTARILVDPMRREMLRLLADRVMTESELAEELGLSDPSVGHHLKILMDAGLIRIVKREAEEHGILQKFYETNALAYFIDDRKMPLEIERYFMPVNVERVRGILAALGAIGGETMSITSRELEDFAKMLASVIVQVAPKYSRYTKIDREQIIHLIYRDALTALVDSSEVLSETAREILLAAREKIRKRR